MNDVTLNSQLVGSAHIHVIGGAGDRARNCEESFIVDDGTVKYFKREKDPLPDKQSCPSSRVYKKGECHTVVYLI